MFQISYEFRVTYFKCKQKEITRIKEYLISEFLDFLSLNSLNVKENSNWYKAVWGGGRKLFPKKLIYKEALIAKNKNLLGTKRKNLKMF